MILLLKLTLNGPHDAKLWLLQLSFYFSENDNMIARKGIDDIGSYRRPIHTIMVSIES